MAKQAQLDAVRPALTDIDKGVTATEKAIDAIVEGTDKATDILEDGLEKMADVVPEAIDKGVEVTAEVAKHGVGILRSPKVIVTGIAVASLAAGVGLGILYYKRRMRKYVIEKDAQFEKELEEMRVYFMQRAKKGSYSTPEGAAASLKVVRESEAHEAAAEYQGRKPRKDVAPPDKPPTVRYDRPITNAEAKEEIKEQPVVVEETAERNVFVNGKPLVDEDWDMEAEEASRDRAQPYIISHDEFMENLFNHPQRSLTYYSGDDVVAEIDDTYIPEPENLLGPDNLKFGHGSRDPNIVYIRNEMQEVDFEVALNDGKYAEQVMGLEHSDSPRLRKARWRDDE